jgi:hypothetical protein
MPAITEAGKAWEKAYNQKLINDQLQSQFATEKAQYELAALRDKQEMSSMSGRAAKAAEAATVLEQMRQKDQGVDISNAPIVPGKSLLDMNKEEGQRLIDERVKQFKQAAVQNFLVKENIMPSAKYDAGGISGETLAYQAPQTQSNVRRQVYQNDYNDFYDMNIHKGESPEVAHQNAIQSAADKQMKAESSGKATVVLPNFGTYTATPEQLNKMLKDPSTPDTVRKAISEQWGGGQQKQSGSDWVRNKLGY